jgi:hypothetical protein
MSVPNPFITAMDKPQHVSWKFFIDNEVYHLEMILPFQAIINEVNPRGGAYLSLCAEVIEDKQLNVSTISKDSMIIVDIPLRTFERAWVCVNRNFRESFSPDHNLRIKFHKKSKQDFNILDIEKKLPCNGQVEFAKSYYNSLPKPSFVRRNKPEEV